MKIIILFLSLVICSQTVYAQYTSLSIHQIVRDLHINISTDLGQDIKLVINQPYFKAKFNVHDIYKEDENNFRITAYQDSLSLQVIMLNGELRGTLYDLHEKIGYKLSYTNQSKLVFTEVSQEQILSVCTFEKTSKYERKHVEHTKIKRANIGNYNEVTNPLLLESRPKAPHLIYVDYDGEPNLTGWGYSANNANIPDEHKIMIWKAMAEDFLPFNVNVTNNRALFESHNELKKVAVVVADFGKQGWRGLAYLNSYGDGRPVLFNYPKPSENSDHTLLTTSSHEVGHALGLNHDGINQNGVWKEYYNGHGEFTPIMGNGGNSVMHWSKGGYPGATNGQDDIAIIGNTFDFVPDDYPLVTNLNVTGLEVNPINNIGFIGNQHDRDTFKIVLNEGGLIDLTVYSPLDTLTNLDVSLQLLEGDKSKIITTSHPVGDRRGYINQLVDVGTYYLVVDGGGELTTADGFNDYSSFGYYEIMGSVGYAAPICDFLIKNESLCLGEKLQIENQSYGSELTYEWTIQGNSTMLSEVQNPEILIDEEGAKTLSLKVSNSTGINRCTQSFQIGGQTIQIKLPKEKIDENFQLIIHDPTNENIMLSFQDFTLLNNELIAERCLSTKCYEVEWINIFKPETSCGIPTWSSTEVYGNIHNISHYVTYMGKIYKAKGYTKGDVPSENKNYPWEIATSVCDITDDVSSIVITDMTTNDILFTTTPVKVGEDLYQKETICFENVSSIDVVTTSPNNCEEVVFKTSVQVNGTNITWDFGVGASPTNATGKGPHNVTYSSATTHTVTLNVDGVVETKNIEIIDLQKTPMISIEANQLKMCEKQEVVFTSTTSFGGKAPKIEWFVNDDFVSNQPNYSSSTLKNNDIITAKLTTVETCVTNSTVISNDITLIVDVCSNIVSTINNENEVKVYPNPIDDIIFITGENIHNIIILNTNGWVVKSYATDVEQIDVSDLNTGIYFIQIETSQRIYFDKLYKK